MKIAVYDIVHLECILPLAKLLTSDDLEVHFFVPLRMQHDIQDNLPLNCYHAHHWHFIGNDSFFKQFTIIRKKLAEHKYDILYLSTIAGKFHMFLLLYFVNPKMKLVTNIHELNHFFSWKKHWSLTVLARRFLKRVLIFLSDAFVVPSQNMVTYYSKMHFSPKRCFLLVTAYHKGNDVEVSSKMNVVVPGSVEGKRRDYHLLLNAWEKVLSLSSHAGYEISLTFAGAVYDEDVLARIRKTELLNSTVTYYESELKEAEFQYLLKGSSVLLSPLVKNVIGSEKIIETYGESKNSGIFQDVIRHGKPLLLTQGVKYPAELTGSVIEFDSAESLAVLLHELARSPETIQHYQNEARKNSEKFSLAIMQQNTINVFNAISTL